MGNDHAPINPPREEKILLQLDMMSFRKNCALAEKQNFTDETFLPEYEKAENACKPN